MHDILKNQIALNQFNELIKTTKASAEIDDEWLGFTEIYKALSDIIPKHWTVIDLGCAYNPQCFLFPNHRLYISVDISKDKKFKSQNCIIYEMSIKDFIEKELSTLDIGLKETFAICSYVPANEETMNIVRNTFKNLFVYYPSNDKLAKRMHKHL